MLNKPAQTAAPINALIRERWSPRSFQSKAVSKADLTAMLEAARWAASCNNGQPWRLIVATSDNAAAHAAALAGFNARNQRWAKTAPVLLFVCARKTFEANGNPNAHAWYDTGMAVAQLTIEAEARGLRLHQAAGIERDVVLNSVVGRVEIWDRDRWEARFAESLQRTSARSGLPRGGVG